MVRYFMKASLIAILNIPLERNWIASCYLGMKNEFCLRWCWIVDWILWLGWWYGLTIELAFDMWESRVYASLFTRVSTPLSLEKTSPVVMDGSSTIHGFVGAA